MAEVFHMKALSTFYGTGGYIVKGQDFFTTSKNLADFYVNQGKAVYTDGNQVEALEEVDLKLQAKNRGYKASEQNEFYTSNLERNVTSLANPINLKIAVEGINPEDLTVEVVRNDEVKYETHTIDQPSQQQNFNPQYENQANQNVYTQQNQQPEYHTLPYPNPTQQDQKRLTPEGQQSSQLNQLEQKEDELLKQLAELQYQKQSLSDEAGQAFGGEQATFEVRHVGGGWYELPNGERIQGRANAENRVKEIHQASLQSQAQGQTQNDQPRFTPNQERVRQANAPHDGSTLNQAQLETFNQGLSGQGVNGGGLQFSQNDGVDFRGSNAQFQTRDSQGQFADGGAQGFQGQGNSGVGGSSSGGGRGTSGGSVGASTSGNTGGGNTSSGGGNVGGNSGPNSGSGGGASTSGNIGQ